MKKILVNTFNPYEVVLGENILENVGDLIKPLVSPCKVLIISDRNVSKLYSDKLICAIPTDYEIFEHVIKPGEKQKNLKTVSNILNVLAKENFSRTDLIIGFGGGVVGDISSFVASIYMRGINYVSIPTTLLSMIDSSIGGKTGVDLKNGKNLVGTFYQPKLVISDYSLLLTLEENEIKNGLGEVYKYSIMNEEIFNQFKKGVSLNLIEKCILEKINYIVDDEKDLNGKRIYLNLGHTIAHAIEKVSSYKISHGIAVTIGLKCMLDSCKKNSLISEEEYIKINNLLPDNLLDCSMYTKDKIVRACYLDKKIVNDKLNVVTILGLGKLKVLPMTIKEFEDFISWN